MNWSEYFTYEDATGNLFWNMRPEHMFKSHRHFAIWNTKNAGRLAGYVHKLNMVPSCIHLRVGKKMIKAHRIIWEMHYGAIPEGMIIDHVDLDPTNNRLSNLRLANRSQNMFNVGPRITNTSGFKGVTRNKRDNKWRAQIKANGVMRNLGNYETIGMAAVAYAKAAIRYHGAFYRLAA